jgi:hypothetical protein
MTTLLELLGKVDELGAEDVICAKPEWHFGSDAKVFRLTDDYRVPADAKAEGYAYFLEVDVIRQVLDELRDRPEATLEEKCARVIHYATYDA